MRSSSYTFCACVENMRHVARAFCAYVHVNRAHACWPAYPTEHAIPHRKYTTDVVKPFQRLS